MDGSEASQIVY